MLTPAEKERIRYHTGYLNISQATAISLGFPSATQLQFIIESAMNSVLPDGERGVRRAIAELDCIEDQRSRFRNSLELVATGDTKIRGREAFEVLDDEYRKWCRKLLDTLGSPVNPFSLDHTAMGTDSAASSQGHRAYLGREDLAPHARRVLRAARRVGPPLVLPPQANHGAHRVLGDGAKDGPGRLSAAGLQ